MWFLIFSFLLFLLILLPIFPSLSELMRPTDNEPLRVVQDYDINVKHFAIGLRTYLEKNFEYFFSQNAEQGGGLDDAYKEGALRDGTRFQSPGRDGLLRFLPEELKKKFTSRLIVSAHPLLLPPDMLYEAEIYSRSTLKMEARCTARALLSEDTMEIGENCTILRWVHSNASLYIGKDFGLLGRASANDDMVLAGRGYFERLTAGRIMFGHSAVAPKENNLPKTPIILKDIAKIKDQYERRWLVRGDLNIPAESFFDGDLVASKAVHIRSGSHIIGSVKSNQSMILGAGTRIDGSIVSGGDIHIESGCQITGQVIAEGKIVIETDVILGTPALPMTANAPRVEIKGNLLVYGTIWADEEGVALIASPKARL